MTTQHSSTTSSGAPIRVNTGWPMKIFAMSGIVFVIWQMVQGWGTLSLRRLLFLLGLLFLSLFLLVLTTTYILASPTIIRVLAPYAHYSMTWDDTHYIETDLKGRIYAFCGNDKRFPLGITLADRNKDALAAFIVNQAQQRDIPIRHLDRVSRSHKNVKGRR
jgi:hypothetical protein